MCPAARVVRSSGGGASDRASGSNSGPSAADAANVWARVCPRSLARIWPRARRRSTVGWGQDHRDRTKLGGRDRRSARRRGRTSRSPDVTDPAEANEAVQAGVEAFGRIDVVVNNAGYGIFGAIEEISDDEARAIFDTNVIGLLNVTRAVLPALRKQTSGRLLNMGSSAGFAAGAGRGIYGASKFAVEGLTEALRDELTPLGIHVTLVEPGSFRTDFLSQESVRHPEVTIADYAESSGKVLEAVRAAGGKQPGNPRRRSRQYDRSPRPRSPRSDSSSEATASHWSRARSTPSPRSSTRGDRLLCRRTSDQDESTGSTRARVMAPRELTGWEPTGRTLLDDLETGNYTS